MCQTAQKCCGNIDFERKRLPPDLPGRSKETTPPPPSFLVPLANGKKWDKRVAPITGDGRGGGVWIEPQKISIPE